MMYAAYNDGRADGAESIMSLIKAMYENNEIMQVPLLRGNKEFLAQKLHEYNIPV